MRWRRSLLLDCVEGPHGGTLGEVTREMDEIHSIGRGASQRCGRDAASSGACASLLRASTPSFLPLSP